MAASDGGAEAAAGATPADDTSFLVAGASAWVSSGLVTSLTTTAEADSMGVGDGSGDGDGVTTADEGAASDGGLTSGLAAVAAAAAESISAGLVFVIGATGGSVTAGAADAA